MPKLHMVSFLQVQPILKSCSFMKKQNLSVYSYNTSASGI